MATVEEVRDLLRASNQELGQSLTQSITNTVMSQVNLLLDTKLKLAEEKLMASLNELARRTAQLEKSMDEKQSEEESDRKGGRTDAHSSGSRSTRASSASASVRGSTANPAVVWMMGFPAEMMEMRLKKFAKAAVEERMKGWSDRIVVKAVNLDQKLSIEFDSEFGAHKFLDLCRETPVKYELTVLRVRPDRTAEVRNRNRILGKLWQQLEAAIKETHPNHKVGQNGPKGKVFVVDPSGEEVHIVFRLANQGATNMVIEVVEEGCKKVGLSEERARDFVDAARAASDRTSGSK
jgi:hypothetical protein